MKVQEKLDWIVQYLKAERVVDVMNSDFVDAYINEFKPKFQVTWFGANKIPELGRILASGYNQGLLERRRVGLSGGAWMLGYPKWVYCYQLKNEKQS